MARPQNLQENLPGLWRISQYFWPHIRKYRALIAASLFSLLAEVGLRLLEPWPLKFVFDQIIHSGQSSRPWAIPALESFDPALLLALAAVAVLAIAGLRAVASYWETIGFAQIGHRV